ncbi:dihydroneopterin aldolase family protein [Methanoculleus sp.]|uniref:dihydroneopterin aldolase family protein n=1 Tax=Methanoculleus sp. TaxID=90427 RepID=UPI002FCC24D0
MITDREKAAFEAGIKLGALYHQFVGTPIARETAASVEAAIEQAVGLQPYVTDIRVRLNRDMMVSNRFGYSELAGKMFDAEITTEVGATACRARLHLEDDYPMMEIVEFHETTCDTDH